MLGHNFMRDTALKFSWYFYLLMEKALVCYFHVWSPYYQVAQHNQKTPIPLSSRWQVSTEKAKKDKHQHTNHSYHQHSMPVSTDLTITDLILTNPIGKEGVQSWSMNKRSTPIWYFYYDIITRRVANKG